jgi:hypothetical protein
MLGRGTRGVYPILPLAPDTPLAIGALNWSGELGIGLATDPGMLDAQAVADVLRKRFADLADERSTPESLTPREGQEQPSA